MSRMIVSPKAGALHHLLGFQEHALDLPLLSRSLSLQTSIMTSKGGHLLVFGASGVSYAYFIACLM